MLRGLSGGSVRSTGCWTRGVQVSSTSQEHDIPHEDSWGITSADLFTKRLQALVIYIAPYLFHVVPVRNNPMFKRVPDLQQPSQLGRGLLPDEHLAFQRSRQHPEVFGPPHERGEVALRQVIPGEASSYRAGAIVEYYWRVVQRFGHLSDRWASDVSFTTKNRVAFSRNRL